MNFDHCLYVIRLMGGQSDVYRQFSLLMSVCQSFKFSARTLADMVRLG